MKYTSSNITNGIALVAGAAFGLLIVSVLKDVVDSKQQHKMLKEFVSMIVDSEEQVA